MFLSQSALSYRLDGDFLKWLVTIIAVFLVAGLIFSQLSLFQGVGDGFKDSIGYRRRRVKAVVMWREAKRKTEVEAKDISALRIQCGRFL